MMFCCCSSSLVTSATLSYECHPNIHLILKNHHFFYYIKQIRTKSNKYQYVQYAVVLVVILLSATRLPSGCRESAGGRRRRRQRPRRLSGRRPPGPSCPSSGSTGTSYWCSPTPAGETSPDCRTHSGGIGTCQGGTAEETSVWW